MSKLTLSPDVTEALEIAGEAVFSLGAARKNLSELEALFRAMVSVADGNTDFVRLAKLGEFAAMDHGNGYDCLREEYELRLEKCAPQNSQSENVARKTGGDE